MLDWQRKHIEGRQKEEKELIEYEKSKLREKWNDETIKEKQKREKEREERINQFNEIQEFNQREFEYKKAFEEQEKQNDKALIQAILDKEKALDELDKKQKVEKKLFFLIKKFSLTQIILND